ncbi:histidine phosphatase family protein [Ornithinimicrobium tianjinense]|uniref:Bifunctional RNase H/acid phosphatase n=1 Tax=Ornithinimicrobium tianjinense TaxID=1195761 RepID=A0A917BMS9_9MICO|nr:histidine phosphatase family protein [Ornithinimicrobium tianjinense]GGF48962.1 bifunctional RNase H/acid phosphatase [Ornithinimicrobium tianjinense]
MTLPTALVVEADGGSRGNPGVAGYGALVRDARTGTLLAERAAPLGRASNNVAEYEGLIAGLQAVVDGYLTDGPLVEVRMDSKLVVEQMSGRWKIKHADMQRLALQARRLVDQVRKAGGSVEFRWVPRDHNKAADALSNLGMDGRTVHRDHGADDSSGPGPKETTGAPALATPTFGDPRAPLSDVVVSPETVPTLEGQTRLILVRHGVTDFTQTHRLDGRGGADPALNATGLSQARAAARAVKDLVDRSSRGPVTVVSSSLRRARQTGQEIADLLGVEREQDADWDEQGFGEWDGRAMPDLVAESGEDLLRLRTDADFAPQGGETRRQLDARVASALGRALARGGTVVVATHRVALMSVLCRLLGIDHDRAWSIATAPASLTAVEVWPDGGVQVAFVNDTWHLRDL